MKDPFEKLTKKEIQEFLTKTDLPLKWKMREMFPYKDIKNNEEKSDKDN